jgi:hypothetical protein
LPTRLGTACTALRWSLADRRCDEAFSHPPGGPGHQRRSAALAPAKRGPPSTRPWVLPFTGHAGSPNAITEEVQGMTHRTLAVTVGAPLEYLKRPSLPTRVAACT